MSDDTDNHPQDQSLLEDASTLLMFSKTPNSSTGSKDIVNAEDNISREQQIPEDGLEAQNMTPSTSTSAGMNIRVITSPGPASAALIKDDSDSTEKPKKTGSKKGIVAAAALAQAATVPLPLKKKIGKEILPSTSTELPIYGERDTIKQEIGIETKTETETETETEIETTVNANPADNMIESEESKERRASVPESYIVDPDDGVITCICGYDDDDGFTIQCDHCYRWQHAICYGIEDENDAPDDFLCNICNPRDVDVRLAKRKQQDRIKNSHNRKRRRSANGPANLRSKDVNSGSKDARSTFNNKGSNPNGSNNQSTINTSSNDNYSNDTSSLQPESSDLLSNTDPLKKIVLMNAKEAYPSVYLPLKTYDFKDPYAELFIRDHKDDDWVIPYSKSKFTPIPIEVKPYSDSNHSRIFPGFPKLGVYTKQVCDEGDIIDEFLGEVDSQKKYVEDPRNNYRVWGTAKPKVIFHPHWPIYIDARLSGNLTRYLRRSCRPNVEFATIKVKNSKQVDDIKFVLRALKGISKGEELQIKWDWDVRHPIWKLITHNETIDSLEEPKRYLLIHSVDTVLGSCDCACGNNNKECHLFKVKRYSQSLYRSVKSKMNNRYKLNEILHGNKLQTKKQTPILSRLAHDAISDAARANEVLLRFNASKLKGLEDTSEMIGKRRTYSNELGTSRAHKYRILHTSLTLSSNNIHGGQKIAIITNPREYTETSINNINDLPIPVNINIDEKKTTIGSIKIEETENGTGSIILKPNTSNNSLSDLNGGSDMALTPTLQTGAHPSMKKKLSFADYKKKLKPT